MQQNPVPAQGGVPFFGEFHHFPVAEDGLLPLTVEIVLGLVFFFVREQFMRPAVNKRKFVILSAGIDGHRHLVQQRLQEIFRFNQRAFLCAFFGDILYQCYHELRLAFRPAHRHFNHMQQFLFPGAGNIFFFRDIQCLSAFQQFFLPFNIRVNLFGRFMRQRTLGIKRFPGSFAKNQFALFIAKQHMTVCRAGIQANRRVLHNGGKETVRPGNLFLLAMTLRNILHNRQYQRFRAGVYQRHFNHMQNLFVAVMVHINFFGVIFDFSFFQHLLFAGTVKSHHIRILVRVRGIDAFYIGFAQDFHTLAVKKGHLIVAVAGIEPQRHIVQHGAKQGAVLQQILFIALPERYIFIYG